MSVVLRTYDGEKATGYSESMALRYCTDPEVRKESALEMYAMRLMGIPRKRIARKYRISERYVDMLIKWIPDDLKERTRARYQSVG
jgi:Holliday junction resolvase RusA-like endonuclease